MNSEYSGLLKFVCFSCANNKSQNIINNKTLKKFYNQCVKNNLSLCCNTESFYFKSFVDVNFDIINYLKDE